MLGVAITAVIIIAVTGLIFYRAMWGGGFGPLTNLLSTTNRSQSRLLNSGLVFVYLAFGIAVPLVFILGNHAKSNAQVAGVRLTASEQVGRELFAEHCAVCHTLSADNAVGKVGPNLDELKPPYATVVHTIEYGCLQNPTAANVNQYCLDYGNMPADIVQGQQATDVAKFVAAVAGHT
jgi:mono/diheme cytochrome c family protein